MMRTRILVEPRVDRPVEQDAGDVLSELVRNLLPVSLAGRVAPPLAKACAVRASRVGADRAELDLAVPTAPEPRAGERAQAGGLALTGADVDVVELDHGHLVQPALVRQGLSAGLGWSRPHDPLVG